MQLRTILIRVIVLAIILWAAFQPGAALNPDPAPQATDAASIAAATATQLPTSTATRAAPSPTAIPATETLLPKITAAATSPVDSSEAIRFAVIGDYGSDSKEEETVSEMVKGWQPDFIITVGDNNYSVGARVTIDRNIGQYFHEYIYPYEGEYGDGADVNRFFPVLGNHDWITSKARAYLDYFSLPGNERYYDFVWGPVHFFALDSSANEPDGIGISSLQAAWLRSALADSTSPWKIVYIHHPPYSSGDVHGSTKAIQWPYEEWGADAVLAGHDHVYERIMQGGFPYFVNGLGGRSRYDFGEALPGSEVRYQENYGAMLVEASEVSIKFEFYALGDENPTLIDSYTITR